MNVVKKIKYQIKNPQGIHATPAGLLVNYFRQFKCNIYIENNEKAVNAKKIFSLMGLAIKQGDTITLTFEGESEDTAVIASETYLRENL